jgi:AraC-like DNA-binding protein
LEERDNYAAVVVEPVERDSRGILHPGAGLERFRLARVAPSRTVARFVDRYWLTSWSLPAGGRHEQVVLVHPVVNVVFEPAGATIGGVRRERFTRELTGAGRVLGVMFRPAGFRPFLGGPMSTLTDTAVPLSTVLPGAAALERAVADALAGGVPDAEIVSLVDRALTAHLPAERQQSEDTTVWAERIATDRELRRVDDVARLAGLSVRGLQRRFADHVGIGPKWMIRRYRLYEVAERAARHETVDWAALATELGYADQAHLVRDFTAAVGEPPARYAGRGPR